MSFHRWLSLHRVKPSRTQRVGRCWDVGWGGGGCGAPVGVDEEEEEPPGAAGTEPFSPTPAAPSWSRGGGGGGGRASGSVPFLPSDLIVCSKGPVDLWMSVRVVGYREKWDGRKDGIPRASFSCGGAWWCGWWGARRQPKKRKEGAWRWEREEVTRSRILDSLRDQVRGYTHASSSAGAIGVQS